MKANKALKRLAKIEASVADLAKRFLPSAPHVRDVLQDAKAAVVRAKEAVLQTSPGQAKKKTKTKKASRQAKKSAAAAKKSTSKKVERKASVTKGKKRTPAKKSPKKKMAKRVASTPMPAIAEITPQEVIQLPAISAG